MGEGIEVNGIEFVVNFLGAIGGGSLIAMLLARWLGSVWASRIIEAEKHKLALDIEDYRFRIAKMNFIFQKEFEAVSDFWYLKDTLSPSCAYPDMDLEDVYEHIAGKFSAIEVQITQYIAKHGPILPQLVMELLLESRSLAGSGKFDADALEIPNSATKASEFLLHKFREVESLLLEKIHGERFSSFNGQDSSAIPPQ